MLMQENFNSLIESYKVLSLDRKKTELLQEIKEIIAIYVKISEIKGIDIEIMKSKEILDVKKSGYIDDDYMEAVYVYLNILKEITSKLILEQL